MMCPTRAPPCAALQMVILDGNSYDTRVVEAGEEREEDLDACALLLNNKATPLLVPGAGGWRGLLRGNTCRLVCWLTGCCGRVGGRAGGQGTLLGPLHAGTAACCSPPAF
jgi:hypothetical protein